MTTWKNTVNLIQDGQPVNSATTNKPLSDLTQRTQFLKETFDAALLGNALIAREQAVSSDTVVGTPVFYNEESSRFEPAQAIADYVDPTDYGLNKCALVTGIVREKLSSNVADILLLGLDPDLDMSAVLGSGYASGPYFLSASEPGKLVAARPPVAIFVCQVMGSMVLVNPTQKDVLEDHIHFNLLLDWRPAGAVTVTSGRVTITADTSKPGWLPADDAYFNGKAPACAKFGYNFAQDPNASKFFPLLPNSYGFVDLNGTGCTPNRCLIDENGIWWLTDKQDKMPWPVGTTGWAALTTPNCDDFPRYYLTLWLTRMTFKTNGTCVTALLPAEGSPIEFVNAQGDDASSGCLYAKITSFMSQRNSNVQSDTAIKAIAGTQFDIGPVVAGIKAAGTFSVTGGTDIGSGYRSGLVTITNTSSDILETGPVEIVALDDARKEIVSDIPVIEFLAGKNASITCKTYLGAFSGSNIQIFVGFWILSRVNGVLPNLAFSIRRILDPVTTTALGYSYTNSTLTFSGSTTAQNYVKVYTPGLAVQSKDMILFKLARNAATGDGYSGNIDILNMFYELRVV